MFKKVSITVFVIMMISSFAFGAHIDLTAPTVQIDPSVNDTINAEIANQVADIENKLNNKYFSQMKDQNDLARGFGNANAITAQNGSIVGYQNYDLFCIMIGSMFGVSTPGYNSSEIESAFEDIPTEGDVYIGAAAGFVVNVGLNSSFIFDNLYLNAKIGWFDYDQTIGETDFSFSQKIFGIGATYSYIDEKSLIGILKWRGITFGTGLTYVSNDLNVGLTNIPDQNGATISVSGYPEYSGGVSVTDIVADLGIKSSALVVPVDINTAVTILILNVGLGAGLDFIIPSSKIDVGGDANVHLTGTLANAETEPGSVDVVASDSKNTAVFSDIVAPRLSASVGLNLWAVKLDFNGHIYPLSNTAALGFSAGVVW